MNNINFDNPYLLFLLIPLLLLVIVPFVVAIRKENSSFHNITSLILHLIIVIMCVGILSGAKYESTITETNIYILADVSYSTNNNSDTIDNYIRSIKKKAPKNSKLGIVCFGSNYELLTPLGSNIRSVKESTVDDSQTNIYSSLEYTASLFKDNVIKRIVLITDGKETNSSNLIALVDSLLAQNIYIDAIYLDSNISPDCDEVEISQINYTHSCFNNRKEKLEILIKSNKPTTGILSLKKKNSSGELELFAQDFISLSQGLNVSSIELDTSIIGNQEYEITISSENDINDKNNSLSFVQKVNEKAKMLVISEKQEDRNYIDSVYGQTNDISYYIKDYNVPFTLEELCVYDEFILSNIDIRKLKNASQFINNIDTLVSDMGKSLITLGNTYIQNNEGYELDKLGSMLPTKYGNNDQEQKLITLVIDISRSMEQLNRFKIAKEVSYGIIDMLKDDDLVSIIGFAGEIKVIQQPISVKNNQDLLKAKIDKCEPFQGTFMGQALKQAYSINYNMRNIVNKEVMLISDGLPFGPEEDEAKRFAAGLSSINVQLSTFQMAATVDNTSGAKLMKELATIGKGNYYYAESEKVVENIILNDLASDITETYINDGIDHELILEKKKDSILNGVESLPSIKEFYYNSRKAKATSIISTDYLSPNNNIYNVPLYTYWNYGNGVVSSLSYVLDSEFLTSNDGLKFLSNIESNSLPKERIETPFVYSFERNGTILDITLHAPNVSLNSTMSLKVISPSGVEQELNLFFNTENYVSSINLNENGNYLFHLDYDYGVMHYESENIYTLNYSDEYDSFTNYDISSLFYVVSGNGNVYEDSNIEFNNDDITIITYRYSFASLFSIIALLSFIADIVIRKLRWQDIKQLFLKTNKGGNK